MQVAIAILNFNGAELLPRFLPSVVRNSDGALVYIIDNGSTDGSLMWALENYPQIKVIKLEQNLGFCSGYNEGLKQIESDIYVLLNSDVEVTAGWLNKPLELLTERMEVAAVQPKILSYKNKNEFEYAGAAGGFLDLLCYPYCRGRILDQLEKDFGQYNNTIEVMWGSGACLFIRAKDFHQHGGFEPAFFAHMEEIDLCWRIRRSGKKIYFTGNSTVYHLGGGTLPVSSPRKTYLNFRNNLSLMFRNLGFTELIIIFPVRMVLDLIASVKFFLEGNGASALAVLKAQLNFIFGIPAELRRRKATGQLEFISIQKLSRIKFLILRRYL